MVEDDTILIAVHSLTYQGKQALGDEWLSFFYALRSCLGQYGVEDEGGDADDLLLFNFKHPFSALKAFYECLAKAKHEFGWQRDAGPVPIQVILHLEKEGDLPPALRDTSSSLWDLLQQETVYISRSLKMQWETLMADKKLPPHRFESDETGLFQVMFPKNSFGRIEKLFPSRNLPRQGTHKECFYCGMTSHKPANCPSKLLSVETKALAEAGYLPIAQLNALFKEAFAHQEKLVNALSTGVTGSQLRKDLTLLAYIAYFDICRVYQLRFLRNIAFSVFPHWDDIRTEANMAVDSQNLHLGLDCLRVGQYAQAEELFVDESRRPKGKSFHATVARAFLALEMERESDMGHYLESAGSIANSESERIYIALLLSRFYDLKENAWKAEHALDNVFSFNRDCTEARYRHVQLFVKSGFWEKAMQQLRALVVKEREMYMFALLDPALLSVQGPVDEMLAVQLGAQKSDAEENLHKAKVQVDELHAWFEAEDEQLHTYINDFNALVKKFERGSYFDTLDVAERSKGLVLGCYRVQETKLSELGVRIEGEISVWEKYNTYWRTYPYQPLFKDFSATLQGVKKKLAEVRALAEKNQGGQIYRKALAMVDALSGELAALKPVLFRMNWVRIVLDGLRIFARKLVITEAVLLFLLLILFPVLSIFLADSGASGFAELLRDPLLKKQVLFVVTVLVAPFAALAQTLWRILET